MNKIIIFAAIILISCKNENKIINFYKHNLVQLDSVNILCRDVLASYPQNDIVIRSDFNNSIRVRVWLDSNNTNSIYFSNKYFKYEFGDDDNSNQEFAIDQKVSALLKNYQKLNIRGIRINEEGVFYIISNALKSNVAGVESGIFIPFKNEFNKANVIQKIDEKAYIYETNVE